MAFLVSILILPIILVSGNGDILSAITGTPKGVEKSGIYTLLLLCLQFHLLYHSYFITSMKNRDIQIGGKIWELIYILALEVFIIITIFNIFSLWISIFLTVMLVSGVYIFKKKINLFI